MFDKYHKVILRNTGQSDYRARVIQCAKVYRKTGDDVDLASYIKVAHRLVAQTGNQRAQIALEFIINIIPLFQRIMLLVEMT